MMITNKDDYFRQKAIDQQNKIVNFKSCNTITSEALVWTYRTTNCDVISLITTAIPIKDGNMKDIRIESFEPKRLKPPTIKKTRKDILGNSPYDLGLSVDMEKKRKKLNQMLHEEKKEFMSKLNITRLVRSRLENDAAKRVQALFRGFLVRNNLGELRYYSNIHKMIRANVRSYLENSKYSTVSLGEYKAERQRLRNNSAALIQCTFLRYLSRKCYRRKHYEVKLSQRHRASMKIQTFIRAIHARARVKVLLEKKHMILCMQSALKIQTTLRAMFARRKVHRRRFKLRWLACRVIQNWYRALYSKRMTAHIKSVMTQRKNNFAAKAIQTLVRSFLSKRRVNRIRLRRLHKFIFDHVTRIQNLIRKFLAKIHVKRRREMKELKVFDDAKQAAIQSQKEEEERIQKENQVLLEETDIFLQAKIGNTVVVEDIFKGLVGEAHSPTETDLYGDTILTIAASTGNVDLVRKCILWDFDINHRNEMGQTAVMIAAKNNHLQVVQYLLGFYHPPTNVGEGEDGSAPSGDVDADLNFDDAKSLHLSSEDIGYLYVAAVANATPSDMVMLQALIHLGMDVNAKSSGTGMTAIHAACEVGHNDAFKLLLKNKARLDDKDDLQQSPLHKAVCSSFKITEWILGLDPNVHTYMTDATRVENILARDIDNKNCLLHASVSGQSDILELLENILSNAPTESKSAKKSASTDAGDDSNTVASSSEEIGWSPIDINKAIHLVESGNLFCIRKILQIGFDPAWPQEDTNCTMALRACQIGDLDVIDLLMEHGTDFSTVDIKGRNAFHLATSCKEQAVVAHLLSHTYANKCKVSKDMLLAKDLEREENPYHYAAREGIELNVDLLATNEIVSQALAMKNKDGMTPFLTACSYYQEKIAQLYMKLGCDVFAVDNVGHGCLWHIFHPHSSILANRRVYCSELVTYATMIPGINNNITRAEKDEETKRIQGEASFIATLVKLGCTLYDNYTLTPDQIKALPYNPTILPTAAEYSKTEPGDIIVQEFSLILMKHLIPGTLSNIDAWRLLLSSIRFDDGSLKVFQHLLKLGVLDMIAPPENENVEDDSGMSKYRRVSRQASITPAVALMMRSNSNIGQIEIVLPEKLSEIYFLDINIVGWAIRLHNVKALQYFVKKGYNILAYVDIWGNPCLHYIAMHGSPDMVDVLVGDKRLRWEGENIKCETAGMLAAKHGNQKVGKKLFDCKASARRSLNGKYAAWVLAFARRSEKFEKNLQTGRYGNDDDIYFNIDPDPYHIMWHTD